MKAQIIPVLLCFALITILPGCEKDNEAVPSSEIETTFELARTQALADNSLEDAYDLLTEAVADHDLMGARIQDVSQTMNNLSCATVTVTPMNGFPKTIVIDFGTGCTSPNGITRSGKINVVLSDSLRLTGSTSVMTFDNYFVMGFKKEGTITWTNTSTATERSWQRVVANGKLTEPGGAFWLHSGTRNVVHISGAQTPRFLSDDEFSITGNSTVTNAAGRTRTSTIINALHKRVICPNIDRGRIRIEGPNHFAILDFGNGACDRDATISIDGNPPRAILLRP